MHNNKSSCQVLIFFSSIKSLLSGSGPIPFHFSLCVIKEKKKENCLKNRNLQEICKIFGLRINGMNERR